MDVEEETSYPTPEWSPISSLQNSDTDKGMLAMKLYINQLMSEKNRIADHDDAQDLTANFGVETYDNNWEYNALSLSTSGYTDGGSVAPQAIEDSTSSLEYTEESPVPHGVPASNDWRGFSIAGALHYPVLPSSGSSQGAGNDVSSHESVSPPYSLNLGI